MRWKMQLQALAAALTLFIATERASAVIIVSNLGTAAPPVTLGSYTMTPFPLDPRSLVGFPIVADVPSPLGGVVGFAPGLSHRRIGMGWATWSHGYTGDVYFNTGTTTVLTLPANTGAFYFYAEPNNFGIFTITATAQDGTSLTQMVNGMAGAAGWGFRHEGGVAGSLTSITIVSAAGAAGSAVGEFGIANVAGVGVPEPSSLVLFGLGGVGAAVLVRRRLRAKA